MIVNNSFAFTQSPKLVRAARKHNHLGKKDSQQPDVRSPHPIPPTLAKIICFGKLLKDRKWIGSNFNALTHKSLAIIGPSFVNLWCRATG
jgi:hypothetical protein